ncbi:lipopolysaccharide biosynthesis protein [Micromonospora ureilytica]|uniref:O-antigen/teichoic acid export membrane protein n=1 Tax=Micromonospora ureilytica TaxID=709868 RepID=A0ABS0JI12_9ACTN|nr:oligosaccharide flippase family protein [Micromonospora ureilytica]MBG6066711.1 O-antigen/teichoic acid export membrane protein [Micromonospora ureilytica]WSR59767.1 oligosaccharide flippase family protein [Micromonospora ureilytica]
MRAPDGRFERPEQPDLAAVGTGRAVQTVEPPAPDAPAPPSSRRGRRLLSWIATAALSRAVSALVPLVLLPVTLSYLGADLYGLWAAVLAVTGMVAFADLGVGLGLMTRLAPCRVSGDSDTARRYVSSAYAAVCGIALPTCGLLWLLGGFVPWPLLFNATGTAARDARLVALVCLTAFLLNIPLSLVARVQYAYQQVAVSNVWQAAASALSLPLALGAVFADLPPIAVIASIAIAPLLVNIANTVWTFGWRLPQLAPRPRFVDGRGIRDLFALGGLFFMVTLLMVLADNADPLIIAHLLGLASVTAYAVPAKLFTQLGALVTLVNQPLWPMHGEALARGDLAWVRRTVRRMTVVSTLIALLPSTFLVLFGEQFFAAWLPIPIGNRSLLVGLACWWLVLAAISPRFMVQNAAGVVRPQLWGYLLYLPLSVVGKVLGVHWLGLSAAPFIAVGVYSLTVVPAAIYGYRRALTVRPT